MAVFISHADKDISITGKIFSDLFDEFTQHPATFIFTLDVIDVGVLIFSVLSINGVPYTLVVAGQ